MAKARAAVHEPIHSKPGERFKNPACAAILMTKRGRKTRNPQAALNPTPIKIGNIHSMLVTEQLPQSESKLLESFSCFDFRYRSTGCQWEIGIKYRNRRVHFLAEEFSKIARS
jgi:hypothetical protein